MWSLSPKDKPVSNTSSSASILALGTAVPPFKAAQQDIGDWMAEAFEGQRALQRLVRMAHRYSGIETRHGCTNDYHVPVAESRFAPGRLPAESPTTAERMEVYQRESVPLGTRAAQDALARYAQAARATSPDVAATITHLITVSCTGFFAPGLDFGIAQALNLAPTVARQHVGFMGCSAAFNGLRAARDIARSQPDARVLVVCVELSSLHMQPSTERDLLVAASLFADGASAALVGQRAPGQPGLFDLDGFHSQIKPDTADEMVWQIGDHGFSLRLSPRIPDHLAEVAPGALIGLFMEDERPAFWAIHPGGRAIVDRLVDIYGLEAKEIASTYDILRRYGNMSSATILFVLDDLYCRLQTGALALHDMDDDVEGNPAQAGVAMAFGPGLVVEMARLRFVAEQE